MRFFAQALGLGAGATLAALALGALGASYAPAPERQSVAEAQVKSAGCVSCHTATDRPTMHQNPAVVLGCTDCHGGGGGGGGPPAGARAEAGERGGLDQGDG